MKEEKFTVVFHGEIASGYTLQQVPQNLANLYKTDVTKVEQRFFTGRPVTIKEDVDYETALKIKTTFENLGAICSVEAIQTVQENNSQEPATTVSSPDLVKPKRPGRRRYWRRLKNRTTGLISLYIVLALISTLFLEQHGTEYLDRTLVKSTASFAVARGLNGIITIFKESSISAGVIVEGNIAIGQILDPINDLIEQFSLIMLISTVSLGIQKVLMEVGFKAGICVFIFALAIFLSGRWNTSGKKIGNQLLIVAIVIQMIIPLTTAIGSIVSSMFLQERYEHSEKIIIQIEQELQQEYGIEGQTQQEQKKEGWLDKINPKKLIQKVSDKISQLADHVVNLIIVFIIETMLLPLAALWGLIKVLEGGAHLSP